MISISQFFEQLGAPLHNIVWSWGARRESDGAIFLRVFQHECRRINEKPMSRVYGKKRPGQRPGAAERAEHVADIRAGAKCYIVMCKAADPKTSSGGVIASYDSNRLFLCDHLQMIEGRWWVERVKSIPARELMPKVRAS